MTDELGRLTPAVAEPQIPRVDGNGCYEVGDRVLARDIVHGWTRAGHIVAITNHGPGKDYIIVKYGDGDDDYFLCEAEFIEDVLPEPEDAEAVERWLESGA